MKNLPLGIYTFKEIIEEDYLYVDKTKEIYKLLEVKSKYFFLSRPRRFGKSLLVSTLEQIFLGNKEIFKGLWIYDKIEFKKYPVIRFDFSKMNSSTSELLEKSLDMELNIISDNYGIEFKRGFDFKARDSSIWNGFENRVVFLCKSIIEACWRVCKIRNRWLAENLRAGKTGVWSSK